MVDGAGGNWRYATAINTRMAHFWHQWMKTWLTGPQFYYDCVGGDEPLLARRHLVAAAGRSRPSSLPVDSCYLGITPAIGETRKLLQLFR